MSRARYETVGGKKLQLALELGRGGEGTVFAIVNSSDCAKIYHHRLDQNRADKIRLMAMHRSQTLAQISSWPIDLVNSSSGEPFGLVMPKFEGMKDVHELYSPKSRREKFVRADWRFLVRASCNIARAFAAIHDGGVVIGDVNHGSILVGQDARAYLVDTDSFQVSFHGKTYLCEKGVETYTAPELQGRSFAGLTRTPDHDNFGLATLIFHLLMMGRHPFAGRFSGAGEMPIAKAIMERRFAYGRDRAKLQMDRPPGTPDLSIVGPQISALFETAFTTAETGRRPTAQNWISALAALEKSLKQCSVAAAHWHLAQETDCPWCQMEKATGIPLFPFISQQATTAGINISTLITKMAGLASLGPAPAINKSELQPSAAVKEAFLERRRLKIASSGLGLVLVIGGFALGSGFWALAGAGTALALYKIIILADKSKAQYQQAVELARSAWIKELALWNRQASGATFDSRKAEFLAKKTEWERLPQLRLQRLDRLQKDRYRLQLERYLDAFSIEGATISGIGAGRKVALASEGIETAADIVEQKLFIPGFGPTIRGKLLSWRSGLERTFVFDATRGVDHMHISAVERDIVIERSKLEKLMVDKAALAVQEYERVISVRKQMRPRIEASYTALEQAEVDLKAAP